MKLNNPFVIRGYAGPEYFCDRETETKKLLREDSRWRRAGLGETNMTDGALVLDPDGRIRVIHEDRAGRLQSRHGALIRIESDDLPR